MRNEAPDRRTKGYVLMRAILDYGMGIMIAGFGVFFLLAPMNAAVYGALGATLGYARLGFRRRG